MSKRTVYIIILWIVLHTSAHLSAQDISNRRFGTIRLDSTSMVLDSLSIMPGSLSITGLDTADYTIDYPTATLHLKNPSKVGSNVTYTYRSMLRDLSRPVSHKSPDLILPHFVDDPTRSHLAPITAPTNRSIFDSDLQGTGSISRGISVGNNQNFVLNSHLNLQLAGTIAPGVEILANITDENLPIQPEGNTRYLKDFNKVFIQLTYKDRLRIEAGDIEITSPTGSHFLQVDRQFIGMKATVNSPIDSTNHLRNTVGGGLSKGKYMRHSITPINGVQGPYRLTGELSETNIIILSGSEQVYLDGVLLTRGQDEDYVIDYNMGEITFTPKRLITEHSRIIVSFEYSDQYYSRYNLFTSNTITHEKNSKLTLDVNFFHEQDLKNQSIRPELTPEQMMFLSGIGDRNDLALFETASPVTEFTGNEILYHRKDTLVEGEYYAPVYVYAGNSHDSVYRVTFSYVGVGKGDYILAQSTANGKMYQWVAPVNGQPQGDYAPVALLNAPKMHDLATVGASYAFNNRLKAGAEVAFSYLDQNLFSKNDDRGNAGLACKADLEFNQPLRARRSQDTAWRYLLNLNYEYVQRNYNPLQSYRDVEFFRNYNLSSDFTNNTDEHLLQLNTGFAHPTCGSTAYTANWLYRAGEMSGLRQQLTSQHRFKGWSWNANTAHLLSADSVQTTNFLKSNNDFSYNLPHISIGVRDNLEYNLFRQAADHAIRANSYAFNEAALYLKNGDTLPYSFQLQYLNRIDYYTQHNTLTLNTIAHEAQTSFECSHWKNNRLKGTFTYRNDQYRDTMHRSQSEHNFVGSIDYYGKFWKGAITLGLYYEVGSGLEQKKSYSFLKVAAGQGTHVWNDYNQNGIEEMDEFEPAAFQSEADYVKVWLPTNEFVNTRNCGATQTLQLRPGAVWKNKKGFLQFLSMFSNSTSLRTYQKNTLQHDIRSINPYQFNLDDSVLVSQNLNLKNSLGFSLPNPYLTADYTYYNAQSKNLLYYGMESNRSINHQVTLRSSPHKILIIKTIYTNNTHNSNSDYLNNRSFDILSHTLNHSITLNFPFQLSLTAICEMAYKNNRIGNDRANLYTAELTADFRMKQRGTISLNLRYTHINYNQQENSAVAYEMLGGLTTGNNFLWNATYQTKLFEYLQLNLQYEGRLTNDNRLIHTGFLQLKALF